MKAQHLKNTPNFTIVDLREYNIQNYQEEINQIIEHANTELKYENVFRSIREEWDKTNLKIIPYRDSLTDYVMVNSDMMSNAIEENLQTLEVISQSEYAAHVRTEI